MKRLLLFCGFLAGLSGAAWGNTADPFIGLDDPPPPGPGIDVGTGFFSNSTGGGTFYYTNDTGGVITELTFQAEVSSFVSTSFSCNSVFFLNCSFTPTANANGVLLTIDFSGVNAPEIAEGCDSEAGEFEGIPIFNAACGNQGVIAITLNTPTEGNPYILQTDGSGGWNDVIPAGQKDVGFTTTAVVHTPEPSTTMSLGLGLLLIAGIGRLRLRRAS